MGRIRKSNEENLPANMYKKGETYYSVSVKSPRKWVRHGKDLLKAIEEHKNLLMYDSRFASQESIRDLPHVYYDGMLVALKARVVQDAIEKIHKRNVCGAKARSITTTLTIKDVEDMYYRSNGRCELTGVQFKIENENKSWKSNPWGPSIDRINSKLPYTAENCRLICHAANIALNEWGDYVFGVLCTGYVNRINSVEDFQFGRSTV